MNKKMRELLDNIQNKVNEARKLQNEGKIKDAKDILDDVNSLKAAYENEKALYEIEKNNVPANKKNEDKASGFVAMAKIATKRKLTDAENALITGTNDDDGANYLVPEDVDTTIKELRKSYISAKDLVTVIPTQSLTGSFVYEKGTPSGLISFDDGDDISAETDPQFEQRKWAVTHKGKVFPVSNVLMHSEKAGLTTYLNNWFVKNAIVSENKDIFEALKDGQDVKSISGLDSLKTSLTVDIDPSALIDAVIVTNQTGFAVMDSEKDDVGRPLLSVDYANPTQKLFQGLPIVVFPDSQLENVAGNAPIFYGNLKAGCNFIDKGGYQFAISEHVHFGKNMTAMRVIESYDVVSADKTAYCYGTIASATSTAETSAKSSK